MAIIAKATDDYQVVFSWAEIFNSPAGDGIIVYFRKNGLSLGNEEGRIALILDSGHSARTTQRQMAERDRGAPGRKMSRTSA